jgi:hypothetical protein
MWSESPTVSRFGAGSPGSAGESGGAEEWTRIWLPRESEIITEDYAYYSDDYLYPIQLLRLPSDFGAYSGGLGAIANTYWYEEIAAILPGYTPFGGVFAMHGYEEDITDYAHGWHESVRIAGGATPYNGTMSWSPAWLWASAQEEGNKVLVWGYSEGGSETESVQLYPFEKTFHTTLPHLSLTLGTGLHSGPYPNSTYENTWRMIGYFGPKFQWDHQDTEYPYDHYYLFDWSQWIMIPNSLYLRWWSPYDPLTSTIIDMSDPNHAEHGTVMPTYQYEITGPGVSVSLEGRVDGDDYQYGVETPGYHVGTYVDEIDVLTDAGLPTPLTGPQIRALTGNWNISGTIAFTDGHTYSFSEDTIYAPLGSAYCGGLWCWVDPVNVDVHGYSHCDYFSFLQEDLESRVDTSYWDDWGTWIMKYDEGLEVRRGNTVKTYDMTGIYAMGLDFGMWCTWIGKDGQTYGAVSHNTGFNLFLSGDPHGGLPGNYDTPPLSFPEICGVIWGQVNNGQWPSSTEITMMVYPPEDIAEQGEGERFEVNTGAQVDHWDLFPTLYSAEPERMSLHLVEHGGAAQKLWEAVSGQYQPDTGAAYRFYDRPPQQGYLEDGPNPRFWGLSVTNTEEYSPGNMFDGPKVSGGWFEEHDSEYPRSTVYRAMYAPWSALTGGGDLLPWWEAITETDPDGSLNNIYLQPGSGNGVMTVQNLDAYLNRFDPWEEEYPGYLYDGFASPFFKRVGPGAPELWYVQPGGTANTTSLRFHRMTWNEGTHRWVDQGPVGPVAGLENGWTRDYGYPVVAAFSEDRYAMGNGGWYNPGAEPWASADRYLEGQWLWVPSSGGRTIPNGQPFDEQLWYETTGGFQSTWAEDGQGDINLYGWQIQTAARGGYLWRLRGQGEGEGVPPALPPGGGSSGTGVGSSGYTGGGVYAPVPTEAPSTETTGVPSGVTVLALTSENKPIPEDTLGERLIITTPGAHYTGWRFEVCVEVRAADVAFDDCEFVGPAVVGSSDFALLNVPSAYNGSCVVTNCTFKPRATYVATIDGVRGCNFTLVSCDISGTCDGIHIYGSLTDRNDPNAGNVTVLNSWIHDLVHYGNPPDTSHSDGSHNDGVQLVGGHNILFQGNRFDGSMYNACMMIQHSLADIYDLNITGNWFSGGAVNLNLSDIDRPYGMGPISITNNVFVRHTTKYDDVPIVVDANTYPKLTWYGNVWHDGSAPLPMIPGHPDTPPPEEPPPTEPPAGYSTYPAGASTFDAGCDAAAKTFLPAAAYSFNDFTQNNAYYGAGLGTCVWLKGAGKTSTVIKMNNYTSTKASAVSALVLGNTNPYHLLKIGSGSGRGGGPLIKFEDFTLTGTPQGHVYNGLRMDYGASGSVLRNVKVTGIPGNDSTPPGETFAANLYDCLNVIVDNCEFDGRINGTGSPVTASMLGLNNSDHATITDTTFKYCGVGFPLAAWQSTGGNLTRCTFDSNNRVPVHIENCDGVWNFYNCTWTNTREFHGVFAASANWASGEAVYNFYDPVYDAFKGDGKFWWRMLLWSGLTYNTDIGSGTTPRAINLYINGVLRPDLLHVQIG